MAMVVYTNIYSTIAQNNLTKANSQLSKSIERLSSGLRINHAADDASGLAISEKLRSQIRGMAKASMNAQDAISFLQTAEGGMEVVGDILQRMRELAVQAGNGIYTSNDRAELQKEVDQLKDEINRISTSTEFNTKKLLTGESAAIWSTSDPDSLEAIVRGAPAEGNYKLAIEAEGGSNFIYKSDIMNVAGVEKTMDTYDYNFEYVGRTKDASFANIYGEVKSPFDVTVNVNTASSTEISANVSSIGVHRGKQGSGVDSSLNVIFSQSDTMQSGYVIIEAVADGDLTNSTATENSFKVTTYDGRTGERRELALPASVVQDGTITVDEVGSFKLGGNKFAAGDRFAFAVTQEATVDEGMPMYQAGGNAPVLAGDTPNNQQYAVLEMDPTGEISVGTGTFSVDNTRSFASYVKVRPELSSKNRMDIKGADIAGASVVPDKSYLAGGYYPDGLEVSVKGGDNAINGRVSMAGQSLTDLNLTVTASGTPTGRTGSYMVETVRPSLGATSASTADFKVTFLDALTGIESVVSATYTSGAGTLDFNGIQLQYSGVGAMVTSDRILVQATVAQEAGNPADANVNIGGMEVRVPLANLDDFNIFNTQMDSSGTVNESNMKLSLVDSRAGMFKFSAPRGKIADLDTKLQDITLFTNADGRMVLDNTRDLTIFANGQKISITMEGDDTVQEFRDKMNQALLDIGLGSGNEVVDNNLVRYVTEEEAQSSGNLAVAGTFIFQAGITGESGEIKLVGDQGVLNALSVATIQEGEDSSLTIDVTDAHTGKFIGRDTIGDNMLRGVIEGIDVKIIDPQLITSYNEVSGEISFAPPATPREMFLHVVDNRTEVQIGANEGQTFDVSLAQLDTTSLEIDNAYVNTMKDAQKAITKFDQALERINSSRATIGAQINRLEYTMQNLNTSRQNLVASESRIRDLDIADETATFSRNQVLVNSAVAMLAQANALPQTALQLIGG
jgi:flagellin